MNWYGTSHCRNVPDFNYLKGITHIWSHVASSAVLGKILSLLGNLPLVDMSHTFLHDSILRLRSTLGETEPQLRSAFTSLEHGVLILWGFVLWVGGLVALGCAPFTTWLYFWAPGLVVALDAGWDGIGLEKFGFGLAPAGIGGESTVLLSFLLLVFTVYWNECLN